MYDEDKKQDSLTFTLFKAHTKPDKDLENTGIEKPSKVPHPTTEQKEGK